MNRLLLAVPAMALALAAGTAPADAEPAGAATLRCQRAVAAAGVRYAGAREKDASKCIAALVRCRLERPGDPACAFRADKACAQAYQKEVALAAGLRASVRKKCDATSLLSASAVGFDLVADRCDGPSTVLDAVERAIACIGDQHACADTRTLVTAAPRTAELLRAAGSLSSLPTEPKCLPDYGDANESLPDPTASRQVGRCVATMVRAGDRDGQGWRAVLGKCLATLFMCAQHPGDESCRARAEAACNAALSKAPAVDVGTVVVDRSCGDAATPFAALVDARGANVAALTAVCRMVGIDAPGSAAAWRACVARTAACRVAESMALVYPHADTMLAAVGRALLPAFCPGAKPPPPRTPTPMPTATSPTPAKTATVTVAKTATATVPRTTTPTVTKSATPTPDDTATPTPFSTVGAVCDPDPAPFGLAAPPPISPCRLDGNPDTFPTLQSERAFANLFFAKPVQLTYAPDGGDRLFVVEQGGTIRVFPNMDNAAASTLFLDLRDLVQCCGEEGLLGMAFHPGYADNGTFYVYYTAPNPRRSVIARYQLSADPNVASPESGQIVLEIPQPYENHNGGQLAFGADGMLYASLGDGGSGGDPENRSQDLGTVLGKILRLDVDGSDPGLAYAIPPDNPFVGIPGARGEIFALGLRNPWRMSFDRLTHDLWAGDVGQESFEEIDRIERGGNYGWRRMEGFACYNPVSGCNDGTLELPVTAYSHADGGCAVIGGTVYRGTRFPELYGAYVYGDYCGGKLWALRWDGATATVQPLASGGPILSAIGEDRDGELYLVDHLAGFIFRLRRPHGASTEAFPRTLSATGCFDDLATRQPAAGLLPYDVQSPLWSDGAGKRRFLVLPAGTTIGHQAQGAWDLPEGTILVKEFTLERERGNPGSATALETRFLVRRAAGWEGYTYEWNEEQTEAYLLDGATSASFDVSDPAQPGIPLAYEHYFPSRSDCRRCHTAAAGGTLGLQTGQLNRTHSFGGVVDNQLRAWEHIGLFGGCLPARPASLPRFADPADMAAPLDTRARSYLHANCAQCHRPNGPAPTAIDLRIETAFAATGLCDALPTAGDLGVPSARLVRPGHADQSIAWLRAAMRGGGQMPPLATLIPDPLGADLLADWITALGACPAPTDSPRDEKRAVGR